MWKPVASIVRAQLAGEWYAERGARLPVAPILFQLVVAAVLCAIARDVLPPHPYALFALTIPLGLGAIALFGELAPLLRADPAAEWVGSLPVRAIELRMARAIVLTILLGGLALGALIPAAVLAPEGAGFLGRLALVGLGLVQALALAAGLLCLQALCARRAEGLLVLLHTLLFVGVLVGFLVGLSGLPALAEIDEPRGALLLLPSGWFAALTPGAPRGTAALLGMGAIAATAVVLALAPFPPAPQARRTRSPLSILLAPFRWVVTRWWLRRGERAGFDLVYDGLPAERDFVSRAYPLMAVPLVFLLLGAGDGSEKGEGLLALALFAPGMYLPVLLLHVPATATPAARWLVDSAPLDPAVEAAGARKAVALRFLTPLYLGLAVLAAVLMDAEFALRLTPAAAAVGLLLLRVLWPLFVRKPPLSTAAGDLGTAWDDSGSGAMFAVGLGTALVALLAWRLLPGPLSGFALLALVLILERVPRLGGARGKEVREVGG